jgi:hypothetical protein
MSAREAAELRRTTAHKRAATRKQAKEAAVTEAARRAEVQRRAHKKALEERQVTSLMTSLPRPVVKC